MILVPIEVEEICSGAGSFLRSANRCRGDHPRRSKCILEDVATLRAPVSFSLGLFHSWAEGHHSKS